MVNNSESTSLVYEFYNKYADNDNVGWKQFLFTCLPEGASYQKLVISLGDLSDLYVRYKGKIYDRVHEADIVVKGNSKIAEMIIRKQNIFTEQKIFPYATINELKSNLIEVCRQKAVNLQSNHPWKNMTDEQLITSAGLLKTDLETGKTGINLAGLLLLGRDDVIMSVCPQYKTDALVRRVNVDRYDDREMIQTNLVESFDLLMQFARKHLNDKFYLEGVQRVSLRDKITREMISNILMHREFSSSFVSFLSSVPKIFSSFFSFTTFLGGGT